MTNDQRGDARKLLIIGLKKKKENISRGCLA